MRIKRSMRGQRAQAPEHNFSRGMKCLAGIVRGAFFFAKWPALERPSRTKMCLLLHMALSGPDHIARQAFTSRMAYPPRLLACGMWDRPPDLASRSSNDSYIPRPVGDGLAL